MEPLRIVLLGKKGAGKSASGNTLLGNKAFHTAASPQGVTKICSKAMATVDGQKLCVVDTPGWFDTIMTKAETIEEIVKCLDLSDPGPHVLFLVLPIGRFTKEEINTVKEIMEVFGDEACKYMMVLFTRGDDLEEGEDFLQTVHPDLKNVIDICEGRYHVFNNRDQNNHMQVSTILQKIKDMVKKNEGKNYTKDIYQNITKQIDIKQELNVTVKRLIHEKLEPQIRSLMMTSETNAKSREREVQINNDVDREDECEEICLNPDSKTNCKNESTKKSKYKEKSQNEQDLKEVELRWQNKFEELQRDVKWEQNLMQTISTLKEEVHELKQLKQQHSEEINSSEIKTGKDEEKSQYQQQLKETEIRWQNKFEEHQRDMENKELNWMQTKGTLEKAVHELKQVEQQHSEEINRLSCEIKTGKDEEKSQYQQQLKEIEIRWQNKFEVHQRDMENKELNWMQTIRTLEKAVHELKQVEQQHSEEISSGCSEIKTGKDEEKSAETGKDSEKCET